ncbi:Asp-tRNA(Asn)/Glu-tRNA(Gln) amidotransferase subunit GatB [Candidatus Bathyarchaeota archaeon]|nr:MAG: Asp-tRNA(Asn)/Glu-tRNA(Gln) amidotransferase GatCAB subunit B [Candidatus Bathyarchaeota archaeon ex4484_40]RJS80238.1 MAG: Asp-tRNA(Asn)/Glu-tRNA(Gln) amidotransferase subunit GatB [Candidatus Bathyarchaeota archaeon]
MSVQGVIIGLEVHVQLTSLKTKLFCGCSSDYRGKEPNTLVCPVCLGLPGALPVLNRKALEYAVMAALALNCKVSKRMFFFRKNYFYPDMPKNFQISQYDRAGGVPLAVNGYLTIEDQNRVKKIRISRIHLEEDPGRLVHLGPIDQSPYTLVDYNRAGIALLEVVTEPDFNSPKEARLFLQKLRSILEHLGIFDGSLEGAMRCDANISLEGGTRVEIKNITSFKEVERALNFEILRQRDLLEKGISVKRETRHWDEARRITVSLRTKEEEQDYRYFPEPDLVPIVLSEEFIKDVKRRMPELPEARMRRFMLSYGLPRYDAEVLVSSKDLADFFEECVKIYNKPKKISNWMMSDLLRCLYENNLELKESKITPQSLVEMIQLIEEGTISVKIAKKILPTMILTGRTPREIVESEGLTKITNRKLLSELIATVFRENPKAVRDALTNEKAVHFLVGQLMKKTKGKADPALANEMIKEMLEAVRRREGSSKASTPS